MVVVVVVVVVLVALFKVSFVNFFGEGEGHADKLDSGRFIYSIHDLFRVMWERWRSYLPAVLRLYMPPSTLP